MDREPESHWRTVGEFDPRKLVEARLQLHWAAQPVMAFADCALEKAPDDSQANLGWRDDIVAMVGRQRPDGLSAGLRIPDMTLLVFDGGGAIAEGVALEGRTMDEAASSLDSITSELTGKQPDTPTKIRDYEMPEHPLAAGARFVMDGPPAYAELARWFANGNLALAELTSSDEDWTEVRCWPHHFDLGTLIGLESSSKSVGAGLSPGDNWYPEPYFYVNPYGLTDGPIDTPPLTFGGRWHTDGWFGAVLSATRILEISENAQEAVVSSFLRGAADAARGLLSA
jgi:hypothetical protein